jgi:hypothetical protein
MVGPKEAFVWGFLVGVALSLVSVIRWTAAP